MPDRLPRPDAPCEWLCLTSGVRHLRAFKFEGKCDFFSLFFISRKIVTVTFWDFLKTCGGDTYPDDKKNRTCNYSLLADLQVPDIGWYNQQNRSFRGSCGRTAKNSRDFSGVSAISSFDPTVTLPYRFPHIHYMECMSDSNYVACHVSDGCLTSWITCNNNVNYFVWQYLSTPNHLWADVINALGWRRSNHHFHHFIANLACLT